MKHTRTCNSDVNQGQLDSFVLLEVWDWDRLTANDFVGGFAMRVQDIIDLTKMEADSSWYKLLDEKRAKVNYERVLADDEASKVCM